MIFLQFKNWKGSHGYHLVQPYWFPLIIRIRDIVMQGALVRGPQGTAVGARERVGMSCSEFSFCKQTRDTFDPCREIVTDRQ